MVEDKNLDKNKAELGGGGQNASSEGPKTWASAPERPEEEAFGQAPSKS